jgi:dTDP-4-dehydrorhamnose 3,5-epimerase
MRCITTDLDGVVIFEPRVFADDRGTFMETFHRDRYAKNGVAMEFCQDNVSISRKGTVRGLHFQHPQPQAKLVQVLQGGVVDVAVDIRRGSPTFGRSVTAVLSEANHR